jgi:chromosome condensin MukBEF ATPase and DNA-binding subunit MukB
MSVDPRQFSSMFSIDVAANPEMSRVSSESDPATEVITLLRIMIQHQEKQNELLAEVNQHLSANQRQRQQELGQWKQANPDLAHSCRVAAETLSRVQTQFLDNLTQDIAENEDCLMDGEFMLNEFVDRYGPRLAHLNGVLQVLSQLSAVPATNPTNNA